MADLNANINVNSSKAQIDVEKLTKALAKATGSLDKLNATMSKSGKYTRKVKGETDKYGTSLSNLERHARSSNKALLGLEAASKAVSNIWRVILGYQIAKNMLQMAGSIEATAQKVELLKNKMKVLTKETQGFDILIQKAYESGIAMDTLGSVVGRFSVATKGAFSVNEMSKWSESLVLAGRAAGTTQKEIDSTLLQLSQAFSANALQGEELRAIRENAPLYLESLRAVADEAGFAGKTIKEMGADGQIGTDMMVKALEKLGIRVEEFKGLTETLESATTRMNGQWSLLVADLYDGQTVFTDLSNWTADLFKNLRETGSATDFLDKAVSEVTIHMAEWNAVFRDTNSIFEQFTYLPGFIIDGLDQLTRKVTSDDNFISLLTRSIMELPSNVSAMFDILIAEFDHVQSLISVGWNKWLNDIGAWFHKKIGSFKIALLELKLAWEDAFGSKVEAARASRDLRLYKQELMNVHIQYVANQAALQNELNISKATRLEAIANATTQAQAASNRIASSRAEFERKQELAKWEKDMMKDINSLQQEFDVEEKAALKVKLDAEKKLQSEKKKTEEVTKKSRKALEAYNKAAVKMKKDLADLKDPIGLELRVDTVGIEKQLTSQLGNLHKLLSSGYHTTEQYNSEVSNMITLFGQLKDASESEFLREMSYEFNEVAKATNEANIATAKLKLLFDEKKISSKLYASELLVVERNLLKVKAANDDLSEGDQMWEGMRQGLYQFSEESKSTFELMADATSGAFDSMTDELTEFVTTGKADFKGMVDSIVKDLTRIAIQKSITEPLADTLFGAMGGMSSGGGTVSADGPDIGGGGMGGLFSSALSWFTNANGNAFDQGKITPFASGGIVNKPTIFPMANGAGLMGEAGPEAIMPLERASNGKLGVAGGGGSTINITINVAASAANEDAMKRSAGQVAQAAAGALGRAQRRNG